MQWYGLLGGPEEKLEDEIDALRERGVGSPHSLLAKACRQLYVNFEEKRDYPTASELHYWSMEALRKGKLLDLIGTLYGALSGYGERPRRAFWVLVAMWGAFAVFYMLVGPSQLNVFPISDFWKFIEHAGQALVYSLGAIARLNPNPRPVSGLFQLLVSIEGILGPLQIALLVLAVRRKVMR